MNGSGNRWAGGRDGQVMRNGKKTGQVGVAGTETTKELQCIQVVLE